MEENRQTHRYALEASVLLDLGREILSGRTRNLSRGGLCAEVEMPLPVGSRLDVTIALVFDDKTFSQSLALPARVVWCTAVGHGRHQVGVAFVGLGREQQSYLETFLRHLDAGSTAQPGRRPIRDEANRDPFAS